MHRTGVPGGARISLPRMLEVTVDGQMPHDDCRWLSAVEKGDSGKLMDFPLQDVSETPDA